MAPRFPTVIDTWVANANASRGRSGFVGKSPGESIPRARRSLRAERIDLCPGNSPSCASMKGYVLAAVRGDSDSAAAAAAYCAMPRFEREDLLSI